MRHNISQVFEYEDGDEYEVDDIESHDGFIDFSCTREFLIISFFAIQSIPELIFPSGYVFLPGY